jgi:hypothetical protein
MRFLDQLHRTNRATGICRGSYFEKLGDNYADKSTPWPFGQLVFLGDQPRLKALLASFNISGCRRFSTENCLLYKKVPWQLVTYASPKRNSRAKALRYAQPALRSGFRNRHQQPKRGALMNGGRRVQTKQALANRGKRIEAKASQLKNFVTACGSILVLPWPCRRAVGR